MDDITTLQEFMGYCLIPSTKAQAMMFIIGNGGEGKSRIGIIMKEIFKNHKGILAVGKRFYAVGRGAKNNIYKGVHKIKGGHKSEK